MPHSLSQRMSIGQHAHHPIRLLIITDVRLYRDGLAAALGARDGLEIVACAGTSDEAVRAALDFAPDLALLDMAMRDGLETVRALAKHAPSLPVIAYAVDDAGETMLACVEAGVAACVPYTGSAAELVAAIESVTQGETICSPRAAALLFRRVASLAAARTTNNAAALTAREREVLGLIENGCSNKVIASRLHIELSTVKNHVHNLLEKLHVSTRAEAVAQTRSDARGSRWRAPEPLSAASR